MFSCLFLKTGLGLGRDHKPRHSFVCQLLHKLYVKLRGLKCCKALSEMQTADVKDNILFFRTTLTLELIFELLI